MDGLGTVPIACLHHGQYHCIAFEKDETIFKEACRVVAEYIQQLDKKENTMASRIKRAAEYQLAVAKVRKRGKEALEEQEVHFVDFLTLWCSWNYL